MILKLYFSLPAAAPSVFRWTAEAIRIDSDKYGSPGCQHLSGGTGELRLAVVAASVGVQMPGGQREPHSQGNRPEVLDGHVARHGNDAARAVGLAHGLIQQRGDNAAVSVAGGSGEAAGEARVADYAAVPGGEKFQP